MTKRTYDMSQESERLELNVPEGLYNFEILSVNLTKSKAGNEMYEITLALENDPSQGTKVYCVTEQGKRWLLKSFLRALDCATTETGEYIFDKEEAEAATGKIINGKVILEENKWLDRSGEERANTKCKVVNFYPRKEYEQEARVYAQEVI
jgi:hypothetical protein